MSTSRIAFGDRAGHGLRIGLGVLGALVRPTLGPSPRAVLHQAPGGKAALAADGWTICQSLELADPLANTGVRLARDVAFRLNNDLGDGIATMVTMFHAGVEAGSRVLAAGFPADRLYPALREQARIVEESWEQLVAPVRSSDELETIATLASDGDEEIGRLVGSGLFDLGKEGFITVADDYGDGCTMEIRKGLMLDAQSASRHLLEGEENAELVLEQPYVLIHDGPIDDFGSVVRILEGFADAKKSLIIVAASFGEEALATLIVNRRRRGLQVAGVIAPGAGRERAQLLDDLAVFSGATIIGPETGSSLQAMRPQHLGSARQATIESKSMRLIEGGGSSAAIESHCMALRRQIERERNLSYDREVLQKRLARFNSGIGTLRVGARTETEGGIRKERAKRAIKASRAALAEGTLPGGGSAFVRGLNALEPSLSDGRSVQWAAAQVLRSMLSAPIAALAENAGYEGNAVLRQLQTSTASDVGFNSETGLTKGMRADGVLDAFPVVREAFRAAVSSVGQVVGLGAAISRMG